MESKNQRLTQISNIIQNEQVTSQEQLLRTLLSQGFSVTQATLSRDLKKLKIAKVPSNDGTYRYAMPDSVTQIGLQEIPEAKNFIDGFVSVEFSGNMGVIKTIPAFSSAISAAIDSQKMNTIVGTIAGDDTIFIVVREGFGKQDVINELLNKFPDLGNKLK